MRTLLPFILLLFSAAHGIASENEAPVSDPDLEKRMVTNYIYKSKPGDSLKLIAHFLYGHESWWKRIQNQNPSLKTFHPAQPIPEATLVRYRAPQVGNIYIVQPNDWLVRIVQWKYGATDQWEEIYRRNAEKISNPDLIHPGDRLILELDGTVRNAGSGEILVRGMNQIDNNVLELSDRVRHFVQVSPQRPLVPIFSQQQLNRLLKKVGEEASDGWSFLIGFLIGLLLLSLIPLYFWYLRRPMHFKKWADQAQLKKLKGMLQMQKKQKKKEKVKKEPQLPPLGRPEEESKLDLSLIHRDEGEVDRRPSYHSIVAEQKKKHYKVE